jgi:hypothetical protein
LGPSGAEDAIRPAIGFAPGDVEPAVRVSIHRNAVYCDDVRVALLVDRDGMREVDEKAKAGGRRSFLLEELKHRLEERLAADEDVERRTGTALANKTTVLLVADAATPARILKEVLYTAKEAGFDRYLLAVERAGRPGEAAAAGCDRYGVATLLRMSEDGARRADGEGGPRTGPVCPSRSVIVDSDGPGVAARPDLLPGNARSLDPAAAGRARIGVANALSLESLLGDPGDGFLDGTLERGPPVDRAAPSADAGPVEGDGGTPTVQPSVRLGRMRPAPGGASRMDGNVFRQRFQAKFRRIEGCYRDALGVDATVFGAATFLVTITPSGTVSAATESSDEKLQEADGAMLRCVESVLATMNFASAPPVGEGDFQVRVPLTFASGSGDDFPPIAPAVPGSGVADLGPRAEPLIPPEAREPVPPPDVPPPSAPAGLVSDPTGDPPCLRLVAVVLRDGRITLMASREFAAEVIPAAAGTEWTGRIDLPNLRMSSAEVPAVREAACSVDDEDGLDFDACAYWTYVEQLLGVAGGEADSPVPIPDLPALGEALRGIEDRALAAFGDRVVDAHAIAIKAEDDVPFWMLAAIMDFARFRAFSYDWRSDEPFASEVARLRSRGVSDPLWDPVSWNDAMRSDLLFPIVMLY